MPDGVDEPHLTGGRIDAAVRLADLDNKLLKHPGIGFKIMLPQEFTVKWSETREFHERAAWTNRMYSSVPVDR